MKKPLVPWTWGSVSRNSGRRGCAYCGHSSVSGSDFEPARIHDPLVLVGVDRADRVDDRAAGRNALGGGAEQRELQLGQRLRAPPQVGPLRHDAEAGARGVDERTVEAVEPRWQLRAVGLDDGDVRGPEQLDVGAQLARAVRVELDGRHVAVQLRRLAAGRGADVEDAFAVA